MESAGPEMNALLQSQAEQLQMSKAILAQIQGGGAPGTLGGTGGASSGASVATPAPPAGPGGTPPGAPPGSGPPGGPPPDGPDPNEYGRARQLWQSAYGVPKDIISTLVHGQQPVTERIFEASGAAYGLYQGAQVAARPLTPIMPNTAQQMGQSWGMPGGQPVQVGPFGFQNPLPIGSNAASGEYYGNLWDATAAGLGPGQTILGNLRMQAGLEEAGWHGDVQDRMATLYGGLMESIGGEGVMDQGIAISMMDKAARLGATDLDSFVDTLRTIPEAARAANMSVDEFAQQVDQVAEGLQQKGLTYGEGVKAASGFSAITNLSPLVGQQLLDNQYVQANIMGSYGLLPEQQGLLFQHPGAMADVTLKTMNQMSDIYKGQFDTIRLPERLGGGVMTAQRQADQMAAQSLGMSVDEYSYMKRHSRTMRQQGIIQQAARTYNRDIDAIGEIDNPARRARLLEDLRAGTGRYSGGKAISWTDLEQMMGKKGSGFSDEEIARLGSIDPAKRSSDILRKIRREGPEDEGEGGVNIKVDLSPAARKLLRVTTDGEERNAANAGQTLQNNRYTDNVNIRAGLPYGASGLGR